MKDTYLICYAVRGIKNLDEWARLSFYKKTFVQNINIHQYNIKGIYGANGSGKSAIVTSLKILKEIITNSGYLNNPLNQKALGELVNKKLGILEYDIEFLSLLFEKARIYHYHVILEKERSGRFRVGREDLTYRIATSHTKNETEIYRISNGAIQYLLKDGEFSERINERTQNLLAYTCFPAIAMETVVSSDLGQIKNSTLRIELALMYLFARGMFAYLEKEDEHTDFFLQKSLEYSETEDIDSGLYNVFKERVNRVWEGNRYLLSPGTMVISKAGYEVFEKQVEQLKGFLRIFKKDLLDISIDKRENQDHFYCNLILHYDGYRIDAEFESTGIKKLIKLFTYLQKMVNGDIVFIDELDSNLHDVYLCALLEYLRQYGKGQLCFTSHNIGPMDVLKQNKQAIDFLSMDHRIYSWVNNGNYSPSKLYKNGMVEGSPFNVDAFDFLGVFETEEGD